MSKKTERKLYQKGTTIPFRTPVSLTSNYG
ncbi:hypothetical protein M2306_003142 [Myroides gitamensis]|nr:hypothetical protein [Myroides odoratus]MDH6602448.1 hypothetical protein [Myroides gitamensis]